MQLELLALIMVFAPLLGATTVGLTTLRIGDYPAQVITCFFTVVSCVCAWVLFFNLSSGEPIVHIKLFRWFESFDFKADWAVYVDMLTVSMVIVVTTVSALVHIYSVGYMSHDPHIARFMSYLSLFTFCMVMLVSSDNFLQLFFGWEGVGVCSYLLIGFWFKKDTANAAAIKAFLVNRVGDFGFALGIFTIFWYFGTVEFNEVFELVPSFIGTEITLFGENCDLITVICLLLFVGAMGKSAQIGLHTWLPDAMEGPTPVSALIHAATMVTAGVFLIARCSPIFEYSPTALEVVTIVGAVTCIFAASVALVQTDIKKIIAYSTCSQLGYMFFACGISAYAAGIFHLMTHGFFKALLFLGAGSVIHAMDGEQDIRKMGGIWKLIPVTYALMWIGSLALAGIFPFAGYYSKDIILESAYASTSFYGQFAYWVGITAAILTAFYSWRLIILTFHGAPRATKNVMQHVHESPLVMLLPLFILAIGAFGFGYYGSQELGIVDDNGFYWRGAIKVLDRNNSLHLAHHVPIWVEHMPLVAGGIGIFVAYLLYIYMPNILVRISRNTKTLNTILQNKWYFDELYEHIFVKPAKRVGRILWKRVDVRIIDGVPNGLAGLSEKSASVLSFFQTGFVYHYAFVMLFGLLVLLTWVVFWLG